mgnify:CR=1 FL=1
MHYIENINFLELLKIILNKNRQFYFRKMTFVSKNVLKFLKFTNLQKIDYGILNKATFVKKNAYRKANDLSKISFLTKELNCLKWPDFKPISSAGNIPTSDKTEYLPPI